MSGRQRELRERAADHPVRVQILDLCKERELSPAALSKALKISISATRYHLLVLLDAHLVKPGEEGRFLLER
jgi:DNA-binding transcriptional ArsR family regulator